MISSSPSLSGPSTIAGIRPAGASDSPVSQHRAADLKKQPRVPVRHALPPAPPAANGLTRFLHQPCMELTIHHDLQPRIGTSNLSDPSTFDAVLRRSRVALLAAADQDPSAGSVLQTAAQVLERNATLRSQSRIVRNALYQG
jgi:hypothetical protein